MKNKILLSIFLAILILGSGPSAALAQPMYTYSFQCITNTNPQNCTIGEKQLRLQVMNIDQGIEFTFINLDKYGSKISSITDIHFDDPTNNASSPLMNYSTVIISPPTDGVAFSADLSPVLSDAIDYSADSPDQPKGVNPGESVYFKIKFSDTANNSEAVAAAIASASFSIDLRMQGFGSGGSESFIVRGSPNGDPVATPEPATMLLLGTGLIGVAGLARRRRKKT